MAPGFYIFCTLHHSFRHSFYGNPINNSARIAQILAESQAKSLAESVSIVNSKGTNALNHAGIPAYSYILIPTLALISAPIFVKELFKQFIKIYKAPIKVLE